MSEIEAVVIERNVLLSNTVESAEVGAGIIFFQSEKLGMTIE